MFFFFMPLYMLKVAELFTDYEIFNNSSLDDQLTAEICALRAKSLFLVGFGWYFVTWIRIQ